MKKDESLDLLLRRTARVDAGTRSLGACLDAETLAAWTDGSLPALERTAAETHAADCDRCLAVLAAMAKTSPPASVAQKPAWLSVRWLVPLTTAALGITVWVLVQEPPRSEPTAAPAAPVVDAAKPAEPAAQRERNANVEARADAPKQNRVAPALPSRSNQKKSDSAKQETVAEKVVVTSPPLAAAAAPASPPPLARPEAKDAREQLQAQAAQLPSLIISPDPSIRWRLVGRSVERSTDGGASWKAQTTGTEVDLLAGSSPAPNVCWIVGRNGVVLLSTDGTTWKQVASPEPKADLVAVIARDGVAATVTTADGRRYSTSDAGRTWTLQENPGDSVLRKRRTNPPFQGVRSMRAGILTVAIVLAAVRSASHRCRHLPR